MTESRSLLTSKLLTAGIVAGPLFVVLSLVQAFMRDGFDPVRHPASMLLLGDLGWIQTANFMLAGALFIACGVGLKRILTDGIGRKWVARLFFIFGVAFIIGGLFTPDPALGFPLGAPEGVVKEMSFHASIHAFAPNLGFLALLAALITLARRFGSQQLGKWKAATITVAITMFVLSIVPNLTADWEKGVFNFLPLWIGTILGFGWTSLVIAKVKDSPKPLKT